MAWAEKLPSGRYRGMYRVGTDKLSAGVFVRKEEAVRQAGAKEVAERGSPTPVGARTLTWGAWEPRWLEVRNVAESTQRSDQGRLRDHVRPYWETKLLLEISTEDVQRWVTKLSINGLAPSTVAKCYHLLSASLKAAQNARLIASNPCKGVTLPPVGPMPERYLDDSEIAAIESSLDDFDKVVVELLLGTGVRLGEAMGLHWESVDLVRKVITIEWAYDPVAQIMKPPKDYERRPIPIGDRLTRVLRDRQKHTGLGRPAPAPVRYPKSSRVHTGLVLAHTKDRPFESNNLRKRFDASVRIAYVGKGRDRHQIGHVRLHDLRHTYASRLLEAGVPINEVSKLLGHASVKTTERYAHRGKDFWKQVRAALP